MSSLHEPTQRGAWVINLEIITRYRKISSQILYFNEDRRNDVYENISNTSLSYIHHISPILRYRDGFLGFKNSIAQTFPSRIFSPFFSHTRHRSSLLPFSFTFSKALAPPLEPAHENVPTLVNSTTKSSF